MAIAEEVDAQIRSDLSRKYREAPRVLDLGMVDVDRDVWFVDPDAPGADTPLVNTAMFPYLIAELDFGGTNLPLSQARTLLTDAAATFRLLAAATVDEDTATRFAAIAPLARSIVERASTVAWVLTAGAADRQLQRALLIEIRGIESLLRYLPKARRDADVSDLDRAREQFLIIADANAGGYTLDRSGLILTVGDQRRPTLTSMVSEATSPEIYAELSVHTHPTGYLHVISSGWGSGGYGQGSFERKSTLHDEGRLCEGAIVAFGKALVGAAEQIGADGRQVFDWADRVMSHYQMWCSINGCA